MQKLVRIRVQHRCSPLGAFMSELPVATVFLAWVFPNTESFPVEAPLRASRSQRQSNIIEGMEFASLWGDDIAAVHLAHPQNTAPSDIDPDKFRVTLVAIRETRDPDPLPYLCTMWSSLAEDIQVTRTSCAHSIVVLLQPIHLPAHSGPDKGHSPSHIRILGPGG